MKKKIIFLIAFNVFNTFGMEITNTRRDSYYKYSLKIDPFIDSESSSEKSSESSNSNDIPSEFSLNQKDACLKIYSDVDKKVYLKSLVFFNKEVTFKKIGCVSYSIRKKKRCKLAHIIRIYVDEEYRRKGYGTILLQEVFKHLGRLNCKAIFIEVFLENNVARTFLEKNGFKNTKMANCTNYQTQQNMLSCSIALLKKSLR